MQRQIPKREIQSCTTRAHQDKYLYFLSLWFPQKRVDKGTWESGTYSRGGTWENANDKLKGWGSNPFDRALGLHTEQPLTEWACWHLTKISEFGRWRQEDHLLQPETQEAVLERNQTVFQQRIVLFIICSWLGEDSISYRWNQRI